ncbi:MAG: hypothetical protein JO157_05140 [Acetobacteraceae bacterium]|nr:hypothetical protein [Acetobacteraceae bacterium]
MLTDIYDLPLSTASTAARDAYVEGCEAKRTMYPGAIEAFDRAIAADPEFALPYAVRAHALLERGEGVAAREAMTRAKALATGLTARETSHIAYFGHLVAGDAEPALAMLPAHLEAYPRDVMVLATTAFTNGLIGSSGRAGQKRQLLELLERLAPHYGPDDWWFTAHHGMALFGERPARRRPPQDRAFTGAESGQPLGGACRRSSRIRGGRSGRFPRLPDIVADELSTKWRALQSSELASGTRPSRGRGRGRRISPVPRRLCSRRAFRAAARQAERRRVVSLAPGTRGTAP